MTEPQWDEVLQEQATRIAVLAAVLRASEIAQFFHMDERFAEADPRMFALHNQAISDAIRSKLGGEA